MNFKSFSGMTKMKLFFHCLLIAMLFATITNAQPQLIEKVEASPDGLVIPYEKWKLPNGLTVIVHEDHSDPVVNVQILYKVGSSRESIGKSGFAHFFEHMMFQGSKHVKDEEHFRIVSEAGGNMNGYTTRDKTLYYDNVPSNQLEVVLWLEADRMGFLLDSLTEKKFESQRNAVKNEKSQNVENQPYRMAMVELINQTLYPYQHPYSWPVIGYVDDLNRVKLQDVKDFFLRWYGPNNAILTIAGDVDSKEALQLVEKYFGSMKPCPEVKKVKLPTPILPTDKYASYKDNIYMPLNLRVYPVAPEYHRDEPALELMADMMGSGNNSIFYKNFVKTKMAVAAFVAFGNPGSGNELSGELQIQIYSYPPEDFNYEKMFNELDLKVKSTIEEFEKTEITEEALQKSKAKKESEILQGTSSVFGKAQMLCTWEWLAPGKFNLADEINRYNKVTKEDVVRVFNRYIKGAGAAVVNVYPKTSSKDSVKSVNPYAGTPLVDDPQYKGLSYSKPADNFDRSARPQAKAPKTVNVPDFYKHQLDNGLHIIGTKTSETPVITLFLEIDGGNLVVEDIKKNGLAELTADVVNEGTQNYTTEQISAELKKLGSTIYLYGGKESTTIMVQSLKKNLDPTLALLEEKLLKPKFDAEDFKRIKKQYREGLKAERTQPNAMAGKAFDNVLYGNTIMGLSPTIKNIDAIELDDVKAYYEKYYSPSVSRLIIAGDVTENEIMPKLNFLTKWKAKEVKIPTIAAAVTGTEPQIYMVHKELAPSSVIILGQVSLPYDATGDYFKNSIMNFSLGGNFNSRLNLNLREDKGYTYGIHSGFDGSKHTGTFDISTSVKRSVTSKALVEILQEVQGYRESGIKDEELTFTKSALLNSQALRYETPYQKALFLSRVDEYNLNKNYTEEQAKILKDITKEEINERIKKYINPGQMMVVIVGDKDLIKDQFKDTNVEIKEFSEKLNFKKLKPLDLD